MGYYIINDPRYAVRSGGRRYEYRDKISKDIAEQIPDEVVAYIEEEGEEASAEEQEQEGNELGLSAEELEGMLEYSGGGWYELPDGESERPKEKAIEVLKEKIREGTISVEREE